MSPSNRPLVAILAFSAAVLVCSGGIAGVLAVSGSGAQSGSQPATGQQLATVITVTDEEVRHNVSASAIDAAAARGDEQALATALAQRVAVLENRSAAIAGEFRVATAAYENGTLSESEYAWRLAMLTARADAVRDGIDHAESRAEGVSAAVLDDTGYDADALTAARSAIEPLTGRGLAALLAQYTGETTGTFSVEAGDGVSIEVESEGGERSREFERERSGSGPVETDALAALENARGALSADGDGVWALTELELDRDDGAYEFEFDYWSGTHVGEAAVAVDGATGEVFSLEAEREPHDGSESLLGVDVHEGSLEPGGTATFVVSFDGEPAPGAVVSVAGERAGTTDDSGTVSLTLPRDGEVEVGVEYRDASTELDLEFGSLDGDDDDEAEDDEDGAEDDDNEAEDDG